MARTLKTSLTRLSDEPLGDILGGIWLVTVMLGLLNLPSLIS